MLLLSLFGPAQAAETLPQLTGIYGDLSYDKQGGLFGTEITIRRSPNGYQASVRVAAAGFGPAFNVPVKFEKDHFLFIVPDESYGRGRYEGDILPTGLVGTRRAKNFRGPDVLAPLWLKRQNKPWS